MVIFYSYVSLPEGTPLVIKHSMDWFCWENVHRKTPMILMEKSMVSGEDVPQQNQSIETWLETPAPKKWKLFHVKIIEVVKVNGGWQHKSHVG